jgi:hypothetical protein
MTSTLEIGIGDEVRASFPGGLFVRGPVQEVNGEQVKVRGRWFRKEDATPAEEIENRIHANEAAERTRRANEQAGIEALKITYSAAFLELWQEAKIENKLRAQRVDVATALEQAYRDDASVVKKAFVRFIISDTTEARERLFEHIKATGALAVEPKPETLAEVSAWYTSLCGECFPENGYSVRVIENPNKWGNEYRVTFPIPSFGLPDLGLSYQSVFAGGKDRLTINSKELFELMVTEGMRL